MTATDAPSEEKTMEQGTRDQAAKTAAIILWVAVIIALGYGVTQTAIQASALFTG